MADSLSSEKNAVLFLCVANSARSQMAEGWFRDLAPDRPVYSAGSHPSIVHPLAIQVMGEVGINITSQRSKGIDSIPLDQVGTVITLCADEVCPVLPGNVRRLHWPLPEPFGAGSTPIEGFRRIRDELRKRIAEFLTSSQPEQE